MFSCRFCSESPFARLFGEDPSSQASTPQGGQGRDSRGTAGRQTRRSPSSFVRRSPEEMKRLVASWDHYVSSRARDFFVTREKLEEVGEARTGFGLSRPLCRACQVAIQNVKIWRLNEVGIFSSQNDLFLRQDEHEMIYPLITVQATMEPSHGPTVLMMIAKSIHHTEDPILGDDNCVFWYGEVTKDDNQAVIRMVKPTEDSESLTYVNRVMVLIFSSDEAFQHLMTLPKAPFRMACGNQLCVSLHHVALN